MSSPLTSLASLPNADMGLFATDENASLASVTHPGRLSPGAHQHQPLSSTFLYSMLACFFAETPTHSAKMVRFTVGNRHDGNGSRSESESEEDEEEEFRQHQQHQQQEARTEEDDVDWEEFLKPSSEAADDDFDLPATPQKRGREQSFLPEGDPEDNEGASETEDTERPKQGEGVNLPESEEEWQSQSASATPVRPFTPIIPNWTESILFTAKEVLPSPCSHRFDRCRVRAEVS